MKFFQPMADLNVGKIINFREWVLREGFEFWRKKKLKRGDGALLFTSKTMRKFKKSKNNWWWRPFFPERKEKGMSLWRCTFIFFLKKVNIILLSTLPILCSCIVSFLLHRKKSNPWLNLILTQFSKFDVFFVRISLFWKLCCLGHCTSLIWQFY